MSHNRFDQNKNISTYPKEIASRRVGYGQFKNVYATGLTKQISMHRVGNGLFKNNNCTERKISAPSKEIYRSWTVLKGLCNLFNKVRICCSNTFKTRLSIYRLYSLSFKNSNEAKKNSMISIIYFLGRYNLYEK
jgi:hypothetical protein